MAINTDKTVEAFKQHQKTLHAYNHALAALSYDSETVMPKGGSAQLGETIGVLSEAEYNLQTDPGFVAMAREITAAGEGAGIDHQTFREAEDVLEEHDKLSRIPVEEYVAFQMLTNDASHVWHSAKVENDYASFEPYLARLIETQRRFAGYLDPGKAPYDVWLNEFERGLNMEQLDGYFKKVRSALVPLIQAIQKAGQPDAKFLSAICPIPLQRELSAYLMGVMTIDPDHCVLGEVEHPFTTEFSKYDVRITTHYHEDQMASNMFSVIHEGGHALYELNVADSLADSVLGCGASMGVHESQSRFFENIIGRSEAFTGYILPKVKELFPEQMASVDARGFYRGVNIAKPSLIRTEADELTYSLHIMVRYELERQLIAGTLSTKELFAAWNALYKEYLGVDVPTDREGVLQDSHWSSGSFGYFPSYSIGSAYAAQMLSSMQKELDVFGLAGNGELAPIVAWLTDKIYKYGQIKRPAELVLNACSAPFDPQYYIDYLTDKFSSLYGL